MRELSKIFNLNRKTIKKYIEINLNDTSLIQKRGRSREKTKPFNKEIQQLFQKGYTARKSLIQLRIKDSLGANRRLGI